MHGQRWGRSESARIAVRHPNHLAPATMWSSVMENGTPSPALPPPRQVAHQSRREAGRDVLDSCLVRASICPQRRRIGIDQDRSGYQLYASNPAALLACSFHSRAFTPTTSSQSISDPSPTAAGARL